MLSVPEIGHVNVVPASPEIDKSFTIILFLYSRVFKGRNLHVLDLVGSQFALDPLGLESPTEITRLL